MAVWPRQAGGPLRRTWRLDTAKRSMLGSFAPKSQTATYEASGSGYGASEGRARLGAAQQWSYTTALDGKDGPITGNNPNADMTR